MLTASFGLTFFMKTPRKETNVRVIYLRITVDGVDRPGIVNHLKRIKVSSVNEVFTIGSFLV